MVSMDRFNPQDPTLLRPSIQGEPPSLHGDKPTNLMECQPQTSILGAPPSLYDDQPTKHVENQPQTSLFCTDGAKDGNMHNERPVVPLPRPLHTLSSLESGSTMNPPEIIIGNVPLTYRYSTLSSVDKITATFHNSTQKNLNYVPPIIQNGETIVQPSLNLIRDGSQWWLHTIVGYFLGRRPYFHDMEAFAKKSWAMVRRVTATANSFFFLPI
ncbi:hypothetical protein Salat_1896200 [Sesamum alatum]|uniref:Uncharacterized protein n=1 Tax=Sesamum alatum TaxID=300844 RepID=A0AAE1Y4P8_9LAMI|nr:hypothetical protein Salat_1896200 [Sesamum alatum]